MNALPGDLGVSASRQSPPILNAMTVDVEDYFQVQAFATRIPRASWDQIPRRIETNVDRLLDLFAESSVRATFFTLGWIAERHPQMVRRIALAGHELASHGYDHTRADQLSPTLFREDIRRSKAIIEDIAGWPVWGYRAPTFSIGSRNQWTYEILEEEGYVYSSSTYPIRHDLYGDTNAPRRPFQPRRSRFWEFPLTTRRLLGQNIPSAGGGYFRLVPYRIWKQNLRHLNRRERVPCIFYFHPWEVDASQPRVPGVSLRARLRHYMNLDTMQPRLARLTRDFLWGRMNEVFVEHFKVANSQT